MVKSPAPAASGRMGEAILALRQKIEAQLKPLGEARVREMVAEGWTLCEWTTADGDTLTLHAQLVKLPMTVPVPAPAASERMGRMSRERFEFLSAQVVGTVRGTALLLPETRELLAETERARFREALLDTALTDEICDHTADCRALADERDAAREEAVRLRRVIEEQPHGFLCGRRADGTHGGPCDCWKREAAR